jgi:hypothetical protein
MDSPVGRKPVYLKSCGKRLRNPRSLILFPSAASAKSGYLRRTRWRMPFIISELTVSEAGTPSRAICVLIKSSSFSWQAAWS